MTDTIRTAAPPGTKTIDPKMAGDVRYYLQQHPRQLPSRYLYDDLGSALFEAICALPWYPITRAEWRLLAAHGAEILTRYRPSTLVELGSGSGDKLRLLLESGTGARRPDVHLVDLSASALETAIAKLGTIDGLRVTTHRAAYEDGLVQAARQFKGPVLVLFLGSNIGNFDPPARHALLRSIRGVLRPGDRFLIGADLIKPEAQLLAAYDDPLGVTAAFNRNLLVRLNAELGADFALDRFTHRAIWNREESRVEMHLVSTVAHSVHIADAGLDLAFDEGEPIWTESSYKYHADDISRILAMAGFDTSSQWIDAEGGFALTLAEAV